MQYIEIVRDFIDFTPFSPDICKVLVELDDDGKVKREIGLNEFNEVVHLYPSNEFKYGKYGLLDQASINMSDQEENLQGWYFNELWYNFHKS